MPTRKLRRSVLSIVRVSYQASEVASELLGHLLRLRHHPQIGQDGVPTRGIFLSGVIIRDRWNNDHVPTLRPVCWRRNLMLCGELHRIEHAEHFIEVAPG